MEEGFYADTLQLQNHRDYIWREETVARMLTEKLYILCISSNTNQTLLYDTLYKKADEIVQYFHAIGQTIDDICLELDELSRRIGSLIEEHTYQNGNYLREIK